MTEEELLYVILEVVFHDSAVPCASCFYAWHARRRNFDQVFRIPKLVKENEKKSRTVVVALCDLISQLSSEPNNDEITTC